MELAIKSIIGAIAIAAISVVASTKSFFLAGLIPLFPTFMLIAHITVGQSGPFELKETTLFGMLSLIPYFLYLLSVYLLSDRLSLYMNLLLSTVVWFTFAVLIYLWWTNFRD